MDISSTSLLVLGQAVKQVDAAAEGMRRGTAVDVETPELGDHADISTETVKLLAGRTAFKVGIALAKAADEMTQQTIDLLA
jgi:hypothetical protein